MIVGDFNVERISISPNEADAILIVDANGVLAFSVALQNLESESRTFHVVQSASLVQDQEPPKGDAFERLKAPHALLVKQALRVSITETANHR